MDDLVRRAESGDTDCEVAVGVVHHSRQEYSDAMRYLSLAAEKGNSNAMVGIGLLHYKGHGVPENEAEATRWFRIGAFKGNVTAMLYLGFQLARKHHAEAMRWFRIAAPKGNADAMLMIGYSYIGMDDRTYESAHMRDDIEGLRWFRMAAENGSADGMSELALSYELGRVVEPDNAEALRWYTMAAGAGHVRSMLLLGLLYDIGFHDEGFHSEEETIKGYPEMVRLFWRRLKVAYWELAGPEYDFNRAAYDPDSDDYASHWALTWFRRAFEQQSRGSEAIFLIGNCFHRNQNYDAALEWYRKAPVWDGFSMIGLGFMYQEGQGVAQDYAEALQWYSKAQENWMGENVGVTKEGAIAAVLIGILHALGRGVPQNAEEACRWFRTEVKPGITPISAGFMSSTLYADRFYGEAYYWLSVSMSEQLPEDLMALAEGKRNSLAKKLSPAKQREIHDLLQNRATSHSQTPK
ncbi:MAG: tetratricopeptide repeat protein [Terracidiphilus sp.]